MNTTTLHTWAYKVLESRIRGAKPFTGALTLVSEAQLGLVFEQALEAEEAGDILADEFEDIKVKLRKIGMTELFY